MKKIIPFNNVLEFNTDVREITAISLEHEIKKYPDMISGVFYISGEYKITDGQLDKEKFNFELPFDIALTNNYNLDSLLVDIDDFRYDIVSDKNLKVNIDLYVDGEEIEPPLPRNTYTEELIKDYDTKDIRDLTKDILKTIPIEKQEYEKSTCNEPELDEFTEYKENDEGKSNENKENNTVEETREEVVVPERIDLLKDMLTNNKEETMSEELNLNINNNNDNNNNDNKNISNNIFTPNKEEDKYVTYRVYKVLETDTLDSILTKYNITKEMLTDYNNIENITPGDKLIIPTINEK